MENTTKIINKNEIQNVYYYFTLSFCNFTAMFSKKNMISNASNKTIHMY